MKILPDKICDVSVIRVSEVAPGPVSPFEALNHPVIKKTDVASLSVDVVSVEDIEDGREDGSGGWWRDTVQSEAL